MKTKFTPDRISIWNAQLITANLVALLACSCAGPRPLRGGRALTRSGTSLLQTLAQGDNPSQPTSQNQETIHVRTYTLPPGSTISQPACTPAIDHPKTRLVSPLPSYSAYPTVTTFSAPITVIEREETRARTELGAAQKDSARELTAKLSSLKPVVWVGVAVLLFGLASFAWPPLRTIIASTTTSAAITLGGLALIVLPSLVVGNELLILGAVTLTIGAWFVAHRHGHLRGQLTRSTARPTPETQN